MLLADLPDPGLARVAEETGGGYTEIRVGQDLGAAFAQVADELHSQSYWIHGGSPVEIHLLVSEGVLAKGMPNWDRILGPEQLKAVTSYVLSMQGTNPPNAKAPEGSEVPTGP
jgi:hypothetical protein